MAVTNFSPLLGLALPTTGDLSGTWGTTVNDAITSLLDSAVAGTTTLSADSDATLSTTNGAANQAREAIILCTGARTALRTITVPAQSKTYVVINATTGGYSVKIVGAGPTTGVTITAGDKALIAWNGSDFVRVGASAGGSDTQVQYNSSGNLAGSANMTFDGTKLSVGGLLNSALTASKPVFTDASKNLVSTGTLGVDQGGTGLATTTAYSVVFTGTTSTGNFQASAGPGTSGHVLTSNGAGALPTFQAPAASGVSQAKATAIAMIYGL